MKYRILKIGDYRFELQYKFLWFWLNIDAYNKRFESQGEAEYYLEQYLYTPKVVKEYEEKTDEN